jgi:predicted AAA+ superfamily ATPase
MSGRPLGRKYSNLWAAAGAARESHIARKTVENYLQILEDPLLGFRLEVFTKRAKRELASHPKFYFFDTGIFRANRPRGPLDSTALLAYPHRRRS